MSRRPVFRLAALATLSATMLLVACGGASGSLAATEAWARPGPAGGDSAAYLTLTNTASVADTLLSASSPMAQSVELHGSMTDASGMTSMAHMDALEIPAGATVTLEPGGKHFMVMGLTTDLAAGASLDLDLVFRNAGTVRVKAEVKQP